MLIESLASELDARRQRRKIEFDAIIARSHDPAPNDARALADLIDVGHVSHKNAAAAITAHLDEHRRQQEAAEAERQRRQARADALAPLLTRWRGLVAEVAHRESLRPFTRSAGLLRAALEGAVALTLPAFAGIEPHERPEHIIAPDARRQVVPCYLRARGWSLVSATPESWRRPDGLSMFDDGAVRRQFDDDLAPLHADLMAFLEPQPIPVDADLPDDTDAAVAQVNTSIELAGARLESLRELDDTDVLPTVQALVAVLAWREPSLAGTFLTSAGYAQRPDGFWHRDDVGALSGRDAVAGEVRQRLRPFRQRIVKGLVRQANLEPVGA